MCLANFRVPRQHEYKCTKPAPAKYMACSSSSSSGSSSSSSSEAEEEQAAEAEDLDMSHIDEYSHSEESASEADNDSGVDGHIPHCHHVANGAHNALASEQPAAIALEAICRYLLLTMRRVS
jgi:hypothetical protein